MKISLASIKRYVDIPSQISDSELVRLIGARLVEVESVIDLEQKYQSSFIVKVLIAEPIPDTHLSRCLIDAGSHPLMAEHPDGIQVVCGAPNVRAGMLAVWLAPGAVVPATFGGENFTLSTRKLRGFISYGMLAGADELDFGDDHSGIVEIAPDFCTPGASFATAFGLNSLLLDIENKSLTHRPDTFGIIGFAREVAGILGLKFTEPDFYQSKTLSDLKISNQLDVNLSLPTDPAICPRYSAAVLELKSGGSLAHSEAAYLTPAAVFLYQSGMRPVSPLVDITNILMLETGQPLHAFDYDKLLQISGQTILSLGVRLARAGEALRLIDGKLAALTDKDIVITAGDTPVALAGAIGGVDSAVDASTTRILLESATFSLYNLRKTQMQHGIFTEAITRFTKGQPAGATLPVLAAAIDRLGITPLAIFDRSASTSGSSSTAPITLSLDYANQLLGTNYSAAVIKDALAAVNLAVDIDSAGIITVTPPFWRPDLKLPVDIVEEIGRLRGYETITPSPALVPLLPVAKNPVFELQSDLRDLLSLRFGAHEVLTYSFISRDLAIKSGLEPDNHYAIANSISPALELFRSHITPSLLAKTYDNLRAGHQNFRLFEFNQVTARALGLDSDQVPIMKKHFSSVLFGNYYSAKAEIAAILAYFGISATFEPVSNTTAPAFFEPLHAALVTVDDQKLGFVGEISGLVRQNFKLLKHQISAFELDCDALIDLINRVSSSLPAIKLSRFPKVYRDLTVKTPTDVSYAELTRAINASLPAELIISFRPTSIYQPAIDSTNISVSKPESETESELEIKLTSSPAPINYSFHFSFASPEKTLTSAEISAIMDKIAQSVSELGATVV